MLFDNIGMVDADFRHFTNILGTAEAPRFSLDFSIVQVGPFVLSDFDESFSEEEIRTAIKSLPLGKVLGRDGSNVEFLCSAWDVIKHDFCDVFAKLHSLNGRRFQWLNEALITLLLKKQDTSSFFDHCSISLIHLIAKLFAKALSLRMAPHLNTMVFTYQSASIIDLAFTTTSSSSRV